MKEQIVKIALEQMLSGGYENLNFANIATELGTSRANLHHHFKNKEGLGIAATEQYIFYDKAFKDDIFREYAGDIRRILEALENKLGDFLVTRNVNNSCILSQLIHDGEAPNSIRTMAVTRYHEEIKQFAAQIEKSKIAKKLPPDTNSHILAVRIMSGIFGMIQMNLITENKQEFKQAVKGLLTAYLT